MFKDANVTVIVSDLDKSMKFYTKTLGLRVKEHAPGHFAEVGLEGLTIGLHPSQKGAQPQATESMSIGLRVDDAYKTMKELQKRGLRFLPDILDDEYVRIAFFKDPDGNPLHLIEFK